MKSGDALNDFIAKKRVQFEKTQARHNARGSTPTFNMRLRVRLGSKLNTDELELVARIMKRQVFIRSRDKGKPISSSEWIVFVAKRFKTIEAAANFGNALQASASIAAAHRGYAIDVGADNIATTSTSDIVKAAVAKEGGYLLDDVHGVDVFANLPNLMIMVMGGTISTTRDPKLLIDEITTVSNQAASIDDDTRTAALMMNAAAFAPHPVAVVALSIAVIESLAIGERWRLEQKAMIKDLRKHVEESSQLCEIDKAELANAIGGLNFGALEKTRRLIRRLGLEAIIPRWEELYRHRSKLLHGSKYVPLPDLQHMAGEASLICKEIFDAHLSTQIKM